MSTLPLICHPSTTSTAIRSAEVELAFGEDRIYAQYVLYGAIATLSVPAPALPARSDELWRRTCFELFLGRRNHSGYFELNFSPSRRWAAYELDAYRRGMRELALPEAPAIESETTPERFALAVTCRLPPRLLEGIADLGVSCVLEQHDGSMSYWALAHRASRPDFHDRSAFTLDARRLHTAGSRA